MVMLKVLNLDSCSFTGAAGSISGTEGVSGMFDAAGGGWDCSIFAGTDPDAAEDAAPCAALAAEDAALFAAAAAEEAAALAASRFGFGIERAAA